MSQKLYMDVHVPLAVTRALRRKGHDVITAQEDSCATLPDDLLLNRAGELGRLLFTQDQDFLEETARRLREGRPFTTVMFASQFVSIGTCVRDLELILGSLADDESTGQLIHLPL